MDRDASDRSGAERPSASRLRVAGLGPETSIRGGLVSSTIMLAIAGVIAILTVTLAPTTAASASTHAYDSVFHPRADGHGWTQGEGDIGDSAIAQGQTLAEQGGGHSGGFPRSVIPRLATNSADEVTGLADEAAAAARPASTQWGQTVQDFQANGDAWSRVSAHAEQASGRIYRGGTSIEEVFARGDQWLVRHRIYDSAGNILHETFRPYAKFGSG